MLDQGRQGPLSPMVYPAPTPEKQDHRLLGPQATREGLGSLFQVSSLLIFSIAVDGMVVRQLRMYISTWCQYQYARVSWRQCSKWHVYLLIVIASCLSLPTDESTTAQQIPSTYFLAPMVFFFKIYLTTYNIVHKTATVCRFKYLRGGIHVFLFIFAQFAISHYKCIIDSCKKNCIK